MSPGRTVEKKKMYWGNNNRLQLKYILKSAKKLKELCGRE